MNVSPFCIYCGKQTDAGMKEGKMRLVAAAVAVSLTYVIMDVICLERMFLPSAVFPDILIPSLTLVAVFHRHALDFGRDGVQLSLLVLTMLSMLPFWPCHPAGLPLKTVLSPLLAVVLMMSESVAADVHRYAKVSRLFRNEAIWHNVMDDSRNFYFTLAMFLVCLDLISLPFPGSRSHVPAVIADVAALALLGAGAARLLTDRTMYMTRGREDELKSLLRGNIRTREIAEGVRERKMKALYKKILDYFEEKKPYLDEDVSLEDISRCLYTNKAYLSKTVNVLSGQNFRQFINYYRVEYAIELIRRDPHLKVEELAMMSGFHNPVSFNMAFRLFKGKTPSEWIHEHRASLR